MLRYLYALAALGLISGLVLGFFGAFHPAFDTMAHFRWHFALGLLGLSLLGLMLKIRRAPLILLLFAMLGVWQSGAGNRTTFNFDVEAAIDKGLVETKSAGTRLKLLHFNLRFDNPFKDEILAMFRRNDPDILALVEVSRQWMPKLETLKTNWPYVFHCPEWNVIGGSMVFSKYPLNHENDQCHSYAALGLTSVQLDETHAYEIGVVHMRWPWPASGPEQLIALEPRLRSVGKDAIIIGDFNAATWSYAVQHFADLAGMHVATGFGGTWMYRLLPPWLAPMLGLPIDNVMAKGSVRIVEAKTLPSIGSDHLPLVVDVLLTDK